MLYDIAHRTLMTTFSADRNCTHVSQTPDRLAADKWTFLTHFMDWCISLNQIRHGHLSMQWLKREILGHKKRFCLTNFCQKKCMLFLSFFLSSSSSSSFFFFFLEDGQCKKRFFFIMFWSPFFPLHGQFFAIFFLAIKKKNWPSAYSLRQEYQKRSEA